MTIRVSVIVPTYKRPVLLRRCLEALLIQDFDPVEFEVIVVADGGDEATHDVVQCLTQATGIAVQPPAIRYLALPEQRGPAAARNLGWRAARGQIIAFTDDDCIPEPGWLRAGCTGFEDDVAGVSGQVIVPLPNTPTDYEQNAAALQQAIFATANCFYRRSVLEKVGGFDERFRAAWREDSDLYFTLLQQNQRLLQAPEAIVIHPVRPAAWGISLHQQRKSMFNALLYKKHPTLYRQHLAPVRPLLYYPIVAALGLVIVGTLRQEYRLARVALSIWFLLSGMFCVRRLKHTSRSPKHIAEMIVTSTLIPPLAIFWRLRGALKYRVIFI